MFCEIPNFGRCCFCFPIRQGVLVFGYVNIVFSALMVALYSYLIHHDVGMDVMIYRGVISDYENVISLILYIFDVVFNVVLVYGAHRRVAVYLKTFCFYVLATLGATVLLELLQIIEGFQYNFYLPLEMIPLFLVGVALNIYLYLLVRSLLRKFETCGVSFNNQLHQFVNGEIKPVENGVYPSTVIPVDCK